MVEISAALQSPFNDSDQLSLIKRKSRRSSDSFTVLSFALPQEAHIARKHAPPSSLPVKYSGEDWRLIRVPRGRDMTQFLNSRSANPVAHATSGRALILAGLLLLRRP
jgi:hypothetical protein